MFNLRSKPICLAASALLLAHFVAGCGGGGGGGGGGNNPPANEPDNKITAVKSTQNVGTINGRSVAPIAEVKSELGYNVMVWGSKDSSGNPLTIDETLTYQTDPSKGIRTVFNGDQIPVLLRVEENGAFITLDWQPQSVDMRFYRGDGAYLGGTKVTSGAGGLNSTRLTGPTGAFQGQFDINGQPGLIAFNVAPKSGVLDQTVASMNSQAGSAESSMTRDRAKSIGQIVSEIFANETNPNQVAKDLINRNLTDIKNNVTPVLLGMVAAGVASIAGAGLFTAAGVGLAVGLVARTILKEVSLDVLFKLNNGTKDGSLIEADSDDSGTSFISASGFETPDSDPSQQVSGVVVASNNLVVPVNGTLDSNGQLILSGTSGGANVDASGTFDGTGFTSGNVNTPIGSGTWSAQPKQLGSCEEQQNSGGEGIFTNIYDLGSSSGSFAFFFDAYSIPDRFQVFNGGTQIYDSSKRSGGDTVNLTLQGGSSIVIVTVTGDESGTAWEYEVGCPSGGPLALTTGCSFTTS